MSIREWRERGVYKRKIDDELWEYVKTVTWIELDGTLMMSCCEFQSFITKQQLWKKVEREKSNRLKKGNSILRFLISSRMMRNFYYWMARWEWPLHKHPIINSIKLLERGVQCRHLELIVRKFLRRFSY